MQDPIIALVGNKSDLASSMEVTLEEAHNLKNENKLDYVKETSAKVEDNNNVHEVFIEVSRRLLKKHKAKLAAEGADIVRSSSVKIGRPSISDPGNKKKSGCC